MVGNISQYLSLDFLLGILITSIVWLFTIKFQDKFKQLFKMRRIWWRAVFVLNICVVFVLLTNYFGFSLWYLLILVVFVSIIVISIIGLPHEWWIAIHVDSCNARSLFIWTTAGRLRFEKAKLNLTNEIDKSEANLRYYHFLKNQELFFYEFWDYYLPALEALYYMGAIKLLKIEISKLEKKGVSDHRLTMLKAYIARCDFRIGDMRNEIEAYLRVSSINTNERTVAYLNMLCVADESNDADLRSKYINLAEGLYFNQNIRSRTLVFDLLHHYGNNGPKEKANEIIDHIIHRKYNNINELFDYADMLYNHYRLLNDQKGQLFALSFFRQRQSEAIDDNDNSRLLVDLAMLTPMLNANAVWREYSLQIFTNNHIYLTHSLEVASSFISQTLTTLRIVNQVYNQFLSEKQYNRLLSDMLDAVNRWEPTLRKEIADTPREMIYKRNKLHLSLIDFIKVRSDRLDDFCKNLDYRMALFEKIIDDCRRNDNKRELLHFLNVYCDEIITTNRQFTNWNITSDSIDVKSYWSKYETVYKPTAMKYIEEMESIIRPNRSNKTVHFYVLYMAYYSKIFGNRQNEYYYFYMFELYKINIRYFNKQVQILYKSIKKDVGAFQ